VRAGCLLRIWEVVIVAEDNPFIGLPNAAHAAIEKVLSRLYAVGDWDDEDEEVLGQWREARGEAAKDHWRWWVGYVDAESYGQEADTREEAIEIGQARYGEDGKFAIIEARLWADDVKEGAEFGEFAEARNHEIVEAANV
jgi:hypothetical protein